MRPKHIKEKREKDVRRIRKRRCEVWKEIRELGSIKLEKPMRHGWFKEIVITHKVERFKHKAAILEVYDMIEKVFWGRTKEEAQKKWLDQTSKYLVYKEFPTLSKRQFNKLSFKAQCLCTPFLFKNECKKQIMRFYIRIPKGAYSIKYTRAYVTHSKRIDPELEQENALIDQQLLKNGYYETCRKRDKWKNYYSHFDRKAEKFKTKRELDSLKNFDLDDIIKENILWEIN